MAKLRKQFFCVPKKPVDTIKNEGFDTLHRIPLYVYELFDKLHIKSFFSINKHNNAPQMKEGNHLLFLPHLGRMIILIAFLNGVRETTSLPVTGRHEMP